MWSQKCLPRGLAEGRKKERAEQGDYREVLEPPLLRESSSCSTALSLVSDDGCRVPQWFCVPCGGKITMVELTNGE